MESSVFPHHAPETTKAIRESATWGTDAELEMESKQTGLALSFPPSPEPTLEAFPGAFSNDYFCPSPDVSEMVSFGLENVIYNAVSDSEESADTLPPSGQEAWPSAAYVELIDADFTNLVGSVEQGYTTISAIKDTLSTCLSISGSSLEVPPPLPTKPCRTTSTLIGKSWSGRQCSYYGNSLSLPSGRFKRD